MAALSRRLTAPGVGGSGNTDIQPQRAALGPIGGRSREARPGSAGYAGANPAIGLVVGWVAELLRSAIVRTIMRRYS
jgi:hypothetical protein